MSNVLTPEQRERLLKQLTPAVRAMRALCVARVHADGDGYGVVLQGWNPLAWITFLFVVVSVFFLQGAQGVREVLSSELNFFVTSRYFQEHPEELEWV